MSRKSIFDILEEQYNIKNEFLKIYILFDKKLIIYTNPRTGREIEITIEDCVDSFVITKWKQRAGFISCIEMRNKLGISTVVGSIEDVVLGLEYFVNLINLLETKIRISKNPQFICTNSYVMLLENINLLLDKINYQKVIVSDEEKVLLVPKEPTATAVAEISSEDTALAILKYHHSTLKNNLTEKRKLLYLIAKEYEPLLSNPTSGFTDYFDKANNMLNNLDIRHNNKDGKNHNDLVANIKNEDLEYWYDELYQLLLFCVSAQDNAKRKTKIADFLKGIKK